jgi:phenylacetate-CoA ligase
MPPRRDREILARLKWSKPQQTRYVESRLKAVLAHAARNVPFYEKRLRQHGLTERDLRHLKDLSVLPTTSKADLEEDADAFLAEGVKKTEVIGRCKGATVDLPLHVYFTPEEDEILRAVERRTVAANGLTKRHKGLWVVAPNQMPPAQSWRERLKQGQRLYLSSFETVAEQLRVVRELKPECLAAPAWILNRLAREILDGVALDFQPALLVSWGEALRPSDRERIQQAFGQMPTEVYQAWEFGPIAVQCARCEGFHVNFDFVHVDVVHDGRLTRPGEAGEVIVTALGNMTMPLIRYNLGDLATWKDTPCPDGWAGPVLAGIGGRLEQAIRLPTGMYVTQQQVERCLDQFENVASYRVIQTQPRTVEVQIVPGPYFEERTQQLLRRKCLELFRNQIGVELQQVKKLAILEGPRRRTVVAKVEKA